MTRGDESDADTLQPLGAQVELGAELAVNLQRPHSRGVACHLVSYGYDEERDAVTVLEDVAVGVRLPGGFEHVRTARLVQPGRPDTMLAVELVAGRHTMTLPRVGPYAIVVLGETAIDAPTAPA